MCLAGARYEHFYIDDGDEIAPEMDLISRKYTKNQHRKWSLAAEDGVWALVFERFSMEYSLRCQHDYLQIEELTNRYESQKLSLLLKNHFVQTTYILIVTNLC